MKKFEYDLSIALIVKNEERCLERCLTSLLPLKNELKIQLIITDTGSKDKTKEIAKKYADTLIDFEWCDDFAMARNTGAEKASGRWFMFIDADESFDESVFEISKFLKSSESNEYNQASIMMKDYKHNKTDFEQYRLTRLFNFEKNKRMFIGSIHEGIPIDGKVYPLECYLSHDGYFQGKSNEKIKRNEALLNKEIEKNPKDLRSYLQIANAIENNFSKLFEIDRMIKAAKDYNLIDSDYYNIAIYEKVKVLNKIGDFINAQNCAQSIIDSLKNDTLIYQEIALEYIKALQETGFYEKSNEIIKKYQTSCEKLKKNPDKYYSLIQTFKTNHDKEFFRSFLTLSANFLKLNKKEEGIKILKEEVATYCEDNRYPLLEEYILNACNLQEFSLISKLYKNNGGDRIKRVLIIEVIEKILSASKHTQLAENLIKELSGDFDGYTTMLKLRSEDEINDKQIDLILKDELLYKNEHFKDALYFDIKNSENKFNFITNCKSEHLLNILKELSNEKQDFKKIVYNSLKEADITDSIKELFYYKNILYFALTSKNDELNSEETAEMFEWFLAISNVYNASIYNDNLDIEDLACINKSDAAVYILYPAYINKEENLAEYVSALKTAIILDENLADTLKFIMQKIQEKVNETVETKNEFSALGVQIKLQIRALIQEKRIQEAVAILEQYEKINPNDEEIKVIKNLINI